MGEEARVGGERPRSRPDGEEGLQDFVDDLGLGRGRGEEGEGVRVRVYVGF